LVAWDLALDLEDLTGEEPDGVGKREDTLVVGGNGNINPVEWRVGVAKGDDGDVHVGCFVEGLMVETGVSDNYEARLMELLGVLIGQGSGNPLSAEVVCLGVSGELKDSALGIRPARHDEDIFGVLVLNSSDDSGGNHEFLPGLGKVDEVNSFLVTLENITFHHLRAVVCSDVHLSSEHIHEVVVSVIRVQKSHYLQIYV